MMISWRWWLTGLAVLLLLFSAQPMIAIGMEYAARNNVQRHFEIERIYVNSTVPGQAQVLRNGSMESVEGLAVRNLLIRDGASIAIRSMDEYAGQIGRTAAQPVIYKREYSWRGQSIRVADSFLPGSVTRDSRAQSILRLTVNDADWSIGRQAEVRPYELDENRYHGYFGMLLVRELGRERLVLVQRADGIGFQFKPENLAWRMLIVDADGTVSEKRVAFGEWTDQPELADYVNRSSASPVSVGYRSGILQTWPSLFFPLLYPIASGVVGVLLLIIVGLSLPLRRRYARKRSNRLT